MTQELAPGAVFAGASHPLFALLHPSMCKSSQPRTTFSYIYIFKIIFYIFLVYLVYILRGGGERKEDEMPLQGLHQAQAPVS
jgi:membrane associated rhomboid family serine protease